MGRSSIKHNQAGKNSVLSVLKYKVRWSTISNVSNKQENIAVVEESAKEAANSSLHHISFF